MKNIYNLLFINRNIRNLSLRKLEKITRISHERLSKYERGVNSMSEEVYSHIMQCMGVQFNINRKDQELQKIYDQLLDDIFDLTIDVNKYYQIIEDNKFIFATCDNCQLMEIILFICDILSNKKITNNIDKLQLTNRRKESFVDTKDYITTIKMITNNR